MRHSVPDADRGVDRHPRRHLPLLSHLEYINPRAHAAAHVPRLLHLQLAAVPAAGAARGVDVADPSDRLRGHQGGPDGW